MSKESKQVKDVCEITCVEREKVDRVKQHLQDQDMNSMSQMFKAMADENRMKIIHALYVEKELCVCDVANIIQSSVATTSHHLRMLRKWGLAKFRKEGKMAYYSLDDEHVKQIVELAFTHQKEVEGRGE